MRSSINIFSSEAKCNASSILKFNSDKADELIAKMKEEVAEIDNHLAHIVDYTVNWYQMLKNKYGKNFPRRTELRNFDTIEAAKVVEANENDTAYTRIRFQCHLDDFGFSIRVGAEIGNP